MKKIIIIFIAVTSVIMLLIFAIKNPFYLRKGSNEVKKQIETIKVLDKTVPVIVKKIYNDGTFSAITNDKTVKVKRVTDKDIEPGKRVIVNRYVRINTSTDEIIEVDIYEY